MQSFGSQRISVTTGLIGLALLAGLIAPVQAQDAGPQDSIEQARTALSLLDEQAGACLTSQSSATTNATAGACVAFRQALDGELLTRYLSACRVARAWRDEYVTRRVETGIDDAAGSADETLRTLVDIDYWCGEDALARRTTNVVAAYGLSRSDISAPLAQTGSVRDLQRQLDTSRQQAIIDRERSRLQEDNLAAQQRLRQETYRQQNDLELELIRQQKQRIYSDTLPR
jgi:hypothetical protein